MIDAATKAAVGDSDPGFMAQMNEAVKKIAAEPNTFAVWKCAYILIGGFFVCHLVKLGLRYIMIF